MTDSPNVNLCAFEAAENHLGQFGKILRKLHLQEGGEAFKLRESCLSDVRRLQQTSMVMLRRAIE